MVVEEGDLLSITLLLFLLVPDIDFSVVVVLVGFFGKLVLILPVLLVRDGSWEGEWTLRLAVGGVILFEDFSVGFLEREVEVLLRVVLLFF